MKGLNKGHRVVGTGPPLPLPGSDTDEEASTHGGNYNHVGWTGRTGLFPLLDWGKPQNCPNDVCVGQEYTH